MSRWRWLGVLLPALAAAVLLWRVTEAPRAGARAVVPPASTVDERPGVATPLQLTSSTLEEGRDQEPDAADADRVIENGELVRIEAPPLDGATAAERPEIDAVADSSPDQMGKAERQVEPDGGATPGPLPELPAPAQAAPDWMDERREAPNSVQLPSIASTSGDMYRPPTNAR